MTKKGSKGAKAPTKKAKRVEGLSVTVVPKALADALAIVGKAVPSKTVRPILSNVRLKVTDKAMTVGGTDMGLSILARVEDPDLTISSEGEVLVPHAKLFTLVKALPAGTPIDLSATKLADADKDAPSFLKVDAGSGEEYSFATEDPHDFPVLAMQSGESKYAILPSDLEKVAAIRVCAAADEARYAIHSVHLSVKQKGKTATLTAEATDGSVGARTTIKMRVMGGKQPKDVLVPPLFLSAALSLLKKDDESPLVVSFGAKKVSVRSAGVQMTTHLLDGTFPDLDEIFASIDSPISFRFLVSDVEPLVRRAVSIASRDSYDSGGAVGQAIRLTIGETEWQMELKQQTSRAQSVLYTEAKGAMPEGLDGTVIGFNPTKLMSLFRLAGDHVFLHLQKNSPERSSVKVTGDDENFIAVASPITFEDV